MIYYNVNVDKNYFNEFISKLKNENTPEANDKIILLKNNHQNEELAISFSNDISFYLNNKKFQQVLKKEDSKSRDKEVFVIEKTNDEHFYIYNKSTNNLEESFHINKKDFYNLEKLKKEYKVFQEYQLINFKNIKEVKEIVVFDMDLKELLYFLSNEVFEFENNSNMVKANLNKILPILKKKIFDEKYPISNNNYYEFLEKLFLNVFKEFNKDQVKHIAGYFEECSNSNNFKLRNKDKLINLKDITLKSELEIIEDINNDLLVLNVEFKKENENLYFISDNLENLCNACIKYKLKLSEYNGYLFEKYIELYSNEFVKVLEREKILAEFIKGYMLSIYYIVKNYEEFIKYDGYDVIIKNHSNDNCDNVYHDISENLRNFVIKIISEIKN